jgi:hypothetical protein
MRKTRVNPANVKAWVCLQVNQTTVAEARAEYASVRSPGSEGWPYLGTWRLPNVHDSLVHVFSPEATDTLEEIGWARHDGR